MGIKSSKSGWLEAIKCTMGTQLHTNCPKPYAISSVRLRIQAGFLFFRPFVACVCHLFVARAPASYLSICRKVSFHFHCISQGFSCGFSHYLFSMLGTLAAFSQQTALCAIVRVSVCFYYRIGVSNDDEKHLLLWSHFFFFFWFGRLSANSTKSFTERQDKIPYLRKFQENVCYFWRLLKIGPSWREMGQRSAISSTCTGCGWRESCRFQIA